jgi:methionyl-tRNA formyltransferase
MLPKYLAGELTPVRQDPEKASYEPMLEKSMGEIDWTLPAEKIACRVRGLNPWPCAFTAMDGDTLKLYLAKAVETDSAAEPGTVIVSGAKAGLIVKCGSGALEILEMQAPGGKRMAPKAYLMGKKIDEGTVLGKDIQA